MAAERIVDSTSLAIEVKSGVDAKGADTYSKKSFQNLRNNCDEQNAYDVAEAIKAVLAQPTRAYFMVQNSELIDNA